MKAITTHTPRRLGMEGAMTLAHESLEARDHDTMRPQLPRPIAKRVRAAVARAPGGASSLLRLSVAGRLPSQAEVGQWIDRAARSLHASA